jgi:hypothetical protein
LAKYIVPTPAALDQPSLGTTFDAAAVIPIFGLFNWGVMSETNSRSVRR